MLCPICKKEIDQNHPQGPQTMEVKGKFVQVCVGCYFGALGDLIEKHPIGIPRAIRGGNYGV